MTQTLACSIVIPTYQEAKNIPPLLQAIYATEFNNREFEVILVDDNSQDGIVEIVSELQKIYPWVRLLQRTGPRNLSQSVIDGFNAANFPLLVSMDADLSHPAEKIPQLLQVLDGNRVDMVIGSRYMRGGSINANWSLHRKIISKIFASIASAFLRVNVHDPLSGFFAIKKSTLMRANKINAIGWKIAIEILIRCRCQRITEIPIQFSERHSGKSKLNIDVGIAFIKQLLQLMHYQFQQRVNPNEAN